MNAMSEEESTVKVIYVDNCCNCCKALQKIFTLAEIKLDLYHWQHRWNDILADNNSPEAGVFRHLMRRAVLHVEPAEYTRAKTKLTYQKRRTPMHKEIMTEANAVIPPPAILRESIEAVLQYVMLKDIETKMKQSMRRGSCRKRFLKSGSVVRETVGGTGTPYG